MPGIDQRVVEKARLHVRKAFQALPKHLHFHDLEHTLSVTRAALAIGQAMRCTPHELLLLETAALFHDIGYLRAYAGHEDESAAMAATFLRREGVSRVDTDRVRRLILATRYDATPRSRLQRILRDADSSKAGQVDFEEWSERLRREQEQVRGRPLGEAEWATENLAYLEHHRFHTEHARRRYGRQRQLNLDRVRARVRTPEKAPPRHQLARVRFNDRDLSWLSFNERVLQEALDPRVPLLERIKFLGIYSNNLDEFYRVRVASLRSLAKLGKRDRGALAIAPDKLVRQINAKALEQQQRFGALYRNELLPALAKKGIRIRGVADVNAKQLKAVQRYYTEQVQPLLHTAAVRPGNAPFIEDRKLYLVCRIRPRGRKRARLVLLNVPSDTLGRFMRLPSAKGKDDLIFLDDVIRLNLKQLFSGHKILDCHAVKLSRDAELYLDEEFTGTMVDKVRKSLRKRQTGVPARFLYDNAMPATTVRALRDLLGLKKEDLVAGGHYHNFSDLLALPVKGHKDLRDPVWPPVEHPRLKQAADLFRVIAERPLLLHFPYHDFGHIVRWLDQAAGDDRVEHIAITLYRVASGSRVCEALLKALANGVRVTVFVEVQARFDERSNLEWGERLEAAGAKVLYSYEGLKVHAKLLLVERREGGRMRRYAYLGTGNFHEGTARLYVDAALLTARPAITREVQEVFRHLADRAHRPALKHLLMAPTGLRSGVEALIDREIEHALKGRPAGIMLKLNSLEDKALVRKLYDASTAGVPVRLIIRGICCIVPGVKGMSERVQGISIVDRYLEHTRAYVFTNGGRTAAYLASADWMERNMDRRVEVAFPLLDPVVKQELLDFLELQWRDNVKARILDADLTNPYVPGTKGEPKVQAQEAARRLLAGTNGSSGKKKVRAGGT
ncbi:MAG: polyphosphate kinase 1 [Flavobacteriales bacterium]|nr:polyphosphate kinase 1 [Flavobacteriales bacterium]